VALSSGHRTQDSPKTTLLSVTAQAPALDEPSDKF
jgi:hypothetical protein